MGTLLQDLRFATRTLLRSPGFTLVAVLTLALGIGATTAIFTLVNSIVIQPLPYPKPDRLVVLRHAAPGLDMPAADQSEGTFLHYRSRNRVFEEMAVYNENVVSVTDGKGHPERVQVALVSPSFFRLSGSYRYAGGCSRRKTRAPVLRVSCCSATTFGPGATGKIRGSSAAPSS